VDAGQQRIDLSRRVVHREASPDRRGDPEPAVQRPGAVVAGAYHDAQVVDYLPGPRCVESKSLKHYLWGFRDRPIFAEALAVEIATEIRDATGAVGVKVVATQHVRGGLVLETTSVLEKD